ncbi:MAG: NAD(P)H-dependent oxidoreductase, partial [Chloroflexota bacterium]
MPTLQIMTVSTRKQRIGPIIASWFVEQAQQYGKFEVEPIDLAEVNLPLFDEPNHPRMQQYENEYT